MNAKNWITAPVDMGDTSCDFKKKFLVDKKVISATLAVSAMGLYAAYINGKRVGRAVLTPGLTSYKKRIQYQVYDVTDMIKKNNEINIVGAPGWAVGEFAWEERVRNFADYYSVIGELTIKFADGTKTVIATNTSWDVYTSVTEFSSIYHGETVNLMHKSRLLGKAKKSDVKSALVEQVGEYIVEQQKVAPAELIVTPKGERVIDFGQNMTGYVEFRIKGKKGERIRITHAEVLDKDGNFYNDNYRHARNEMIYVLDGKENVFKPRFSFQGFRYIRIEEYPAQEIDLSAITAIVVYSEIKRTGYFKCGNEKINQLYSNAVWGQRGNYLDIPTDCPQRDERMGWTGDAQVFCRTAAINYDVKRFFKKWLGDMAIEQRADGAVAGVVPEINQKWDGTFRTRISAAWGDAATVIPWELYMAYGDRELLSENFEMMRKWVEYMHTTGSEEFLWLGEKKHYGDWLAMDADPDVYMGATPTDFIASAYFAYSTGLLVKAGEVLGKDMTEYKALYENVVKRFREYFMENGMPKEGVVDVIPNAQQKIVKNVTQTAIVLILHFGLCTEEERAALTDKLCELIHDFDDRMTTGFVGTPYILHALTDNGRSDVAYKLLMQEKNPSWLFSVDHGATTIWEHWNGMKEDGSFWSTDMNSFNHYAYGAVCDWLFGCACGIKPTSPAYKTVKIAPNPSRVLGSAQYCIDTVNGRLISKWYYRGDDIRYEIEIPEAVTAEVVLPDGKTYNLGAGEYVFYSKA